MKKVGVVRFTGTNCDRDVFSWVEAKSADRSWNAEYLWHQDQFSISDYELVIIPGGFSFGDYLRSGALAAVSPVMNSVREFAHKGRPVLGICNGFQILCESQLLPGVLVRNTHRRFIDRWVELEVENPRPHFSEKPQQKYRLPIAHGDGRFYAPTDQLQEIQDQGLVWLKYKENPNGSLRDIAGIMNKNKNVFGLMPHPERALYPWMGSEDGWNFI
jgi:phosphoribosylformylglycinamidine synthase I